MENFLLIGICIISGMLFRRSNTLPENAHKAINAWVIYLALPAVSFKYLPHIEWDTTLLLPAVAPLIVWLGAWIWISIYAKNKHLNKLTEGGLKLSSGLSNTSFLGFPLIVAYFGEKELGIAIIYDQVNFLLLATAGIIVAINSSKKQTLTGGVIIKRLLRFPPFLGCIAALILPSFISLSPFEPLFNKLAATVGPMALFSIGLQLQFASWKNEIKNISAALLYKLMIAPALVTLIVLLSGIKGTIAQVSIFEAAMPTLITSGIVADEYGLNPKLSNLIIGIGILLALVTTAIWYLVLQYLN